MDAAKAFGPTGKTGKELHEAATEAVRGGYDHRSGGSPPLRLRAAAKEHAKVSGAKTFNQHFEHEHWHAEQARQDRDPVRSTMHAAMRLAHANAQGTAKSETEEKPMIFAPPGTGMMARTVFRNAKCDDCLHFDAQKGLTGVCMIGQQPANCGEGDYPLMGFAPLEMGGGPNIPARLVQPLSDATHVPLVRSIVSKLEEAIRHGCPMHATKAISEGDCKCRNVSKTIAADAFWENLPNRTRAVTKREDADAFVFRAMGVEPPATPQAPAISKPKKTKNAPAIPSDQMGKSVEEGLDELEGLVGGAVSKSEEHSHGMMAHPGPIASRHSSEYKNPLHQRMGKVAESHGAGHHVSKEGVFHLHSDYTHKDHPGKLFVEHAPVHNMKQLGEHLGY